MYKMIVCDLDETLLNDDGSMSNENISAIKAATEKGVFFVPNSGRSYKSFQRNLKAVDLYDKKNQYSISYNGGLILENEDNRPIAVNSMPLSVAEAVFKVGIANPKASTHVYAEDNLYIYNPIPDDLAYLSSRGVEFEEIISTDFAQFDDQSIMKIIMALPTMAERQQMQADVEKQVDAQKLAVTYSSDRYVEFNPAGVDKGTATLELGQLLDISADEIIAVGDNGNDLPMLNAVGMPISVANGIESVKDTAKYITEADNNHGAVAEIINKFIL